MATYLEIYNLYTGSSNLKNRAVVAVMNAATRILFENEDTKNHIGRVEWALDALSNPGPKVNQMLIAIITDGGAQVAKDALPDADLQAIIDKYIDVLLRPDNASIAVMST
jgi:hypothetical protein